MVPPSTSFINITTMLSFCMTPMDQVNVLFNYKSVRMTRAGGIKDKTTTTTINITKTRVWCSWRLNQVRDTEWSGFSSVRWMAFEKEL